MTIVSSPNVARLNTANTFNGTVTAIGGFRFPDGSVQTSAAGKGYTTLTSSELEIGQQPNTSPLLILNLRPGNYLLTATVQFENKANNFLQD
jgi:hypothetical protein